MYNDIKKQKFEIFISNLLILLCKMFTDFKSKYTYINKINNALLR